MHFSKLQSALTLWPKLVSENKLSIFTRMHEPILSDSRKIYNAFFSTLQIQTECQVKVSNCNFCSLKFRWTAQIFQFTQESQFEVFGKNSMGKH